MTTNSDRIKTLTKELHDAQAMNHELLRQLDEARIAANATLYAAVMGEPTTLPLLQPIVDTLELWLHDGRFYVANSVPHDRCVRRLEETITAVRERFPELKPYEGPHALGIS
jgi:hypothetical protein